MDHDSRHRRHRPAGRRFRPLLVLALVALTAVAAGILYWAFIAIYLSTVDWFVF